MPLEWHQLDLGEVSFSNSLSSFRHFICWASSFWIGVVVTTRDIYSLSDELGSA